MSCFSDRPILDTGIGLRACHYNEILEKLPNVPWFEALSDNYFDDAAQLDCLKTIRQHYPMTLHGVGMSIGSTDPLNFSYLKKLRDLAEIIKPTFISDHLSWSSVSEHYLHDLLPLPFTQEAVEHVSSRVKQVQDFLGCRILLENASSYLEYEANEMPEWDFINAIANNADCYILLDINNIYVSAFNQKFDSIEYINNIDSERVKQFHLAGYSDEKTYLFDMHNQTIHEPVWALYEVALKKIGILPALIERDDNIPAFDVLFAEAKKSDQIMKAMRDKHAIIS